jgi:hypothetical protein
MASQTASSAGLPLSVASGGGEDDSGAVADSSRELPPTGTAARVLGMFSGVVAMAPTIREARAAAACAARLRVRFAADSRARLASRFRRL